MVSKTQLNEVGIKTITNCDALLDGFAYLLVTGIQALEVDEIGGGEHHGGEFAALQHALDAAVLFARARGLLKVRIEDDRRSAVLRGVPGKRKNSIGGEDGLISDRPGARVAPRRPGIPLPWQWGPCLFCRDDGRAIR